MNASKDNVSATDKVNDKSKDLNNVEAKGAYDVALARAEGNHKVAVEKCNAVSGDAQSKCKDMAAADLRCCQGQRESIGSVDQTPVIDANVA
jgi:hypothetical protein